MEAQLPASGVECEQARAQNRPERVAAGLGAYGRSKGYHHRERKLAAVGTKAQGHVVSKVAEKPVPFGVGHARNGGDCSSRGVTATVCVEEVQQARAYRRRSGSQQ